MSAFKKAARKKGYRLIDLAERWGITPRQMSRIAAKPTKRHIDALRGLPEQPLVQKAGWKSGTRPPWLRNQHERTKALSPIRRMQIARDGEDD